jgi:hypothetical protein
MFALVTASQMASASAASFFRRLRRFNRRRTITLPCPSTAWT